MENLEALKKLTENLPKEVKGNAQTLVERMGQKIEGIGDEPISWRPENLRLVQPTSDRSKLPKNANIGSIVVGDAIMVQPAKIIPLRMWDSRQYWSPDKDEARLLCSSPDAVLGYIGKYCKDCEFAKFDTEANRSACNKGKTVLAITSDLSRIIIINFSKTNYANGKDWAGLMRKAGVAPFKRVYQLTAETNKKFKQVESLVINTENENTPDTFIPFLEELFSKVGEDREEHKKKFYEIVLAKKQTSNLLDSPGANDNIIPALTADTTTAQNDMSKKYSL